MASATTSPPRSPFSLAIFVLRGDTKIISPVHPDVGVPEHKPPMSCVNLVPSDLCPATTSSPADDGTKALWKQRGHVISRSPETSLTLSAATLNGLSGSPHCNDERIICSQPLMGSILLQ